MGPSISYSLWSCARRKITWTGLTKFVILGQKCRWWSRKKQLKTVKKKKQTEATLVGLLCYKYSWISFSALEKKTHSWFSLKRNLLCFLIHPLLIKVVRSRWLNISLVIICPFLRTSTSYRSIKMPQKNSPNIQKSWQHSWLIIHRYWCYSTIMTMFSNSVTLCIVAKIGSKTCITISEFSKKKWDS